MRGVATGLVQCSDLDRLASRGGYPKEAAVCGRKDETTGQAIVAFVSLKGGEEGSPEMMSELREHVATKIGKIARPSNIVFTPELPKSSRRSRTAPWPRP